MATSIDFKNAVSEGKIMLVRIILKDSLIIDPTFTEFDEMYNYANGKIDNLLEDFDDGELDNDKSHWSKDYMNEMKVELMGNFSTKRIQHLKQICSYIYRDKVKTIENKPRNTPPSSKYSTQKSVAKGAVVGGVAIAAVGVAVAETTILAIGAVVAAAGVVVLVGKK